MQQTSMFCRYCKKRTLHQRPGTSHVLHLLLSLLTAGLWIIVWIGCAIKIGGWRCSHCGTKGGNLIAVIFLGLLALVVFLGIGVFKNTSRQIKNIESTLEKSDTSAKRSAK